MAGFKHYASSQGARAECEDESAQIKSSVLKLSDPSNLVLQAMFAREDDRGFKCKVATTRASSSKAHNELVRVSPKSYSNLKEHATIWHGSLFKRLNDLNDSGASLAALKAVVVDENQSVEQLASIKPICILFRSILTKSQAILQSRAAYALHLISKGHSFNSLEDPLLVKAL